MQRYGRRGKTNAKRHESVPTVIVKQQAFVVSMTICLRRAPPLRRWSFCLHKLAQLRVSLRTASFDTTPPTHVNVLT